MSVEPSAIDDRFWERLRYRGVSVKQHVLADLPDSAASLLGDRVWRSFKQRCATEGNLVPLLISQLEPQDPGLFRRRGPRKPKGSDPFADLPRLQRLLAGRGEVQATLSQVGGESAFLAACYLDWSCPPTDPPPARLRLGQADAADQRRRPLSAEVPETRLAPTGGVQ